MYQDPNGDGDTYRSTKTVYRWDDGELKRERITVTKQYKWYLAWVTPYTFIFGLVVSFGSASMYYAVAQAYGEFKTSTSLQIGATVFVLFWAAFYFWRGINTITEN